MPTLEARIINAEQKNGGYVRFETDGRPRFFDTKREDLIDLGYRLMDEGEVVVLEYNEVESTNVNPRDGKPYTNRYFEGVARSNGRGRHREERRDRDRDREPEPARGRDREPERAPVRREVPATESYGYRTHPESAWRMALTSGSERAVQTMPLMPSEQRSFETQKQIALAWAKWIVSTPMPDEPEAYRETPDDDIPFMPTLGPFGL